MSSCVCPLPSLLSTPLPEQYSTKRYGMFWCRNVTCYSFRAAVNIFIAKMDLAAMLMWRLPLLVINPETIITHSAVPSVRPRFLGSFCSLLTFSGPLFGSLPIGIDRSHTSRFAPDSKKTKLAACYFFFYI